MRALEAPDGNERVQFLKRLIADKGYETQTDEGRTRLKNYLLANSARVRRKYAAFEQELRNARASSDPTKEVAARSVLFRNRGIASTPRSCRTTRSSARAPR